MTRAFRPDPIDPDLLDVVLDTARRVPSAGSSQGFDFLVLAGADQVRRYWDVTLPAERRETFRFPHLLAAPVIVLVYADAGRYVERYAELDKRRTGLGESRAAWSTPYWLVDASFAAFALQLAALDAGLGVLFFGVFEHAEAVGAEFGVPVDREVIGAIAMGHPLDVEDGSGAEGRSAHRLKRGLDDVAHRGGW